MGTTPAPVDASLHELKAHIRVQQETGSLKELALACCALLARTDQAGLAPDADALELVKHRQG